VTAAVAQFNIGRLLHPLDDPRTEGFAAGLYRVNAMAERSEGYLWHDRDTAAGAKGLGVPFDDPLVISTLSVWRSPADLHAFVYASLHNSFYRRKAQWFGKVEGATNVVWPVAENHRPTVAEGLERLRHLDAHGPSDDCFDLAWYGKMQGAA
jgi:hypothetical protein